MGMDIHMSIVKDGEVLQQDIFKGRSSEWFRNLQLEGYDPEYDYFPTKYGLSPQSPKSDDYYNEEKLKDWGYFGFHYISVEDFVNWYRTYQPSLHAGWATTYEKWLIETKNISPKDDLPTEQPTGGEPYYFVEYVDQYDCSTYIYQFLIEHDVPLNADVTYYFDC